MGLYDMVGDDGTHVAGMPAGMALRPTDALIARGQILSGTKLIVPKSSTVTLTMKTQAPFRANSVCLVSLGVGRGLSNVTVGNIKVGTNEQLIGETNDVPLDAFAPDQMLGKVQFDTAQVAQVISITLTNNSTTADETVAAALFGTRLDK